MRNPMGNSSLLKLVPDPTQRYRWACLKSSDKHEPALKKAQFKNTTHGEKLAYQSSEILANGDYIFFAMCS